jgi:hypothetical protein
LVLMILFILADSSLKQWEFHPPNTEVAKKDSKNSIFIVISLCYNTYIFKYPVESLIIPFRVFLY